MAEKELRAKWEFVSNNHEWWWECGRCGERPIMTRRGSTQVMPQYCPNCGSRMWNRCGVWNSKGER